jgi:thioredoxin-related protein
VDPVNEVLQWAAIVVLAIVAFGTLRQIGMWLPVEARSNTDSGPRLSKRVRGDNLTPITQALALSDNGQDRGLVAFVSESCVQCQRLIADIDSESKPALPLTFVSRNPTPDFAKALRETGFPVVEDRGELWQSWHVTSTPLVLKIDGQGRVLAKGVTHRVDTVALARS